MELSEIKGLGRTRIETLKSHAIEDAKSLLFHFPKFYFDLDNPELFSEDGRFKLIKATVLGEVKVVRIRKDFTYSMCECCDHFARKFKAIWYNQTYLKSAIEKGDTLYLYGKNSNTKKNFFVVSTYKNAKKLDRLSGLLPVYKTFKNVGQSILTSSVLSALEGEKLTSIFPKDIEEEFIKSDLNSAIKALHFPTSKEELEKAKERVDLERIMPYIKFGDLVKKQKNDSKCRSYSDFESTYSQICDFLPFNLTQSQKEVLKDIKRDMLSKTKMNRLIQGDVGAGKTVLALVASAVAVSSGYSALLVAPTQILAAQHFEILKPFFEALNLDIAFLSSSVKAAQRRIVIDKINSGKPMLLVGTQSLLSDDIQSDNIALVTIDEQHRFGVKARTKLIKKSEMTDLLMLSATPIPRSLALVYYGDVDISVLKAMPREKQIQTNIVSPAKEEDLWNFVEEKIKGESKAFVVCANIDENDDDAYIGLSAKEFYKKMCARFGKEKVLLSHGKLSDEEGKAALENFRKGKEKILVSTTVVEVGIDIKEADIMVIVSPEKFGLATLHQLRGRIGRAGQKAYCFCLSRNISENSIERIKFFKEHLDGFEIAEFDFSARGAGSIFGTRQHGKIENIFDCISVKTLENASQIYKKISEKYDTDFLISSELYNKLSDISLN